MVPCAYFCAIGTALLLQAEIVVAFQLYQGNIPNGALVERNGVPWPGVGHTAAAGGGGSGVNVFGAAFAAASYFWSQELCHSDSDGDGFSNGMELGDPDCVWGRGDTPHRTSGITHPGFADSFPAPSRTTTLTGLPSFSATATHTESAASATRSRSPTATLAIAPLHHSTSRTTTTDAHHDHRTATQRTLRAAQTPTLTLEAPNDAAPPTEGADTSSPSPSGNATASPPGAFIRHHRIAFVGAELAIFDLDATLRGLLHAAVQTDLRVLLDDAALIAAVVWQAHTAAVDAAAPLERLELLVQSMSFLLRHLNDVHVATMHSLASATGSVAGTSDEEGKPTGVVAALFREARSSAAAAAEVSVEMAIASPDATPAPWPATSSQPATPAPATPSPPTQAPSLPEANEASCGDGCVAGLVIGVGAAVTLSIALGVYVILRRKGDRNAERATLETDAISRRHRRAPLPTAQRPPPEYDWSDHIGAVGQAEGPRLPHVDPYYDDFSEDFSSGDRGGVPPHHVSWTAATPHFSHSARRDPFATPGTNTGGSRSEVREMSHLTSNGSFVSLPSPPPPPPPPPSGYALSPLQPPYSSTTPSPSPPPSHQPSARHHRSGRFGLHA